MFVFSQVLEAVSGKVLAVAEHAIHFTFRFNTISLPLQDYFSILKTDVLSTCSSIWWEPPYQPRRQRGDCSSHPWPNLHFWFHQFALSGTHPQFTQVTQCVSQSEIPWQSTERICISERFSARARLWQSKSKSLSGTMSLSSAPLVSSILFTILSKGRHPKKNGIFWEFFPNRGGGSSQFPKLLQINQGFFGMPKSFLGS